MGRGRVRFNFSFILVMFLIGVIMSYDAAPSVILTSKLNSESSDTQGFTSHATIMISNNDDFSPHGFKGQGTSENPFILENVNITSDTPCIRIHNTTSHFVVRNSLVQGKTNSNDVGIFLYNVSNGVIEACTIRMRSPCISIEESSFCEIQNCTVNEITNKGVSILNSSNCTIVGCSMNGNGSFGVWMHRANGCSISKCNFTEIYNAIYVESSNWFIISNCTITSGGGMGIWLYCIGNCIIVDNEIHHFSKGIYANIGDWIYIERNLIYSVSTEGILISSGVQFLIARHNIIHHCSTGISTIGESFYSLITNNTIFSNEGIGIYDGPTAGLGDYYYNILGWNSINAKDDHETIYWQNTWDDGISHGNFWSDYNGTGSYSLPGSDVILIDTYPEELTDVVKPILGSPDDLIFEQGGFGNYINWYASDEFPQYYKLFINGSDFTKDWLGGHIIENFDNVNVGTWNVTILVVDCAQNNSTDTLWITVIPNTPPTINGPSTLVYEAGQVGNWLSWCCADLSPASYRILRNNSLLISGNWNGANISINIDSLSVGVYNYTLILEDVQGSTSSHSVIVTVLAVRRFTDMIGLLIPAVCVLVPAVGVSFLIIYYWRKTDRHQVG